MLPELLATHPPTAQLCLTTPMTSFLVTMVHVHRDTPSSRPYTLKPRFPTPHNSLLPIGGAGCPRPAAVLPPGHRPPGASAVLPPQPPAAARLAAAGGRHRHRPAEQQGWVGEARVGPLGQRGLLRARRVTESVSRFAFGKAGPRLATLWQAVREQVVR